MTEQINELEKALRGSLMHENECAFVHTSTIQLCLVSLKAWDEVLNELEHMLEIVWQDTDNDARIVRANAWDNNELLVKVIDIINQKLSEIEEGEEYE